MEEATRYQATFEGMYLGSPGEWKQKLTIKPPKGPFLVELRCREGKWSAALPTNQGFGAVRSMKKLDDAKSATEGLFERKLTDWVAM